MKTSNWYQVNDTSEIISPAVLVYPDKIERNIRQMASMVSDIGLLRPHIKTHKTAEIVQMQMQVGIHKFKCATIAEAELLAMCKAKDILLAMPLVGANIHRLVKLMDTYPDSKFSALIDNPKTMIEVATVAEKNKKAISLWLDINVGMNRTGILPNENALELCRQMHENGHIEIKGFHVYDGHIRDMDLKRRKINCDTAFEPVLKLKNDLEKEDIPINTIVAGGSPSFPIHAKRGTVETAPGTTLLWDAGYGTLFADMKFEHAAVLLTRIISKPSTNTLCFDLGHKSIAPEMNFPRIAFLNLPDSEQIGQSEEHLVVRVKDSNQYEVGDVCYAIPMHVCPTIAKYDTLLVVDQGNVIDHWQVTARNQKITV